MPTQNPLASVSCGLHPLLEGRGLVASVLCGLHPLLEGRGLVTMSLCWGNLKRIKEVREDMAGGLKTYDLHTFKHALPCLLRPDGCCGSGGKWDQWWPNSWSQFKLCCKNPPLTWQVTCNPHWGYRYSKGQINPTHTHTPAYLTHNPHGFQNLWQSLKEAHQIFGWHHLQWDPCCTCYPTKCSFICSPPLCNSRVKFTTFCGPKKCWPGRSPQLSEELSISSAHCYML